MGIYYIEDLNFGYKHRKLSPKNQGEIFVGSYGVCEKGIIWVDHNNIIGSYLRILDETLYKFEDINYCHIMLISKPLFLKITKSMTDHQTNE